MICQAECMSIERYGILNDIHFPYEDKARYKVALNIFQKVGINHLYLNGDIAEFQAVSTHSKHPAEQMAFCKEVKYCNDRFDQIEKLFPGVPVTLIEGNHCYRFFRYIRDIAPQMWGLIDCPIILGFDKRPNWKFVSYGPSQLQRAGKSNLFLRHEPLSASLGAAKITAEGSYVDIAFGHTHRYQSYTHRKFGPSPITNTAYSLGWLGDRKYACFDYRGSKDTWVEGCTIVECDTETGKYSLEFINLQKLPALYRGELFTAK